MRDLRTSLGSNLHVLREESGLDPWETPRSVLRDGLRMRDTAMVPTQDVWRLPYLNKLLAAQQEAYFGNDEGHVLLISETIENLVKN